MPTNIFIKLCRPSTLQEPRMDFQQRLKRPSLKLAKLVARGKGEASRRLAGGSCDVVPPVRDAVCGSCPSRIFAHVSSVWLYPQTACCSMRRCSWAKSCPLLLPLITGPHCSKCRAAGQDQLLCPISVGPQPEHAAVHLPDSFIAASAHRPIGVATGRAGAEAAGEHQWYIAGYR